MAHAGDDRKTSLTVANEASSTDYYAYQQMLPDDGFYSSMLPNQDWFLPIGVPDTHKFQTSAPEPDVSGFILDDGSALQEDFWSTMPFGGFAEHGPLLHPVHNMSNPWQGLTEVVSVDVLHAPMPGDVLTTENAYFDHGSISAHEMLTQRAPPPTTTAHTAVPNATAMHSQAPLPNLPASAIAAGFRPEQFDKRTHYMSTKPDSVTYMDVPKDLPIDLLLHADPKLLTGGNLLRLAQEHSNADILRLVNQDRPEPVFNTTQAVGSRLATAFRLAGKEFNLTPAQVKEWLNERRRLNGVRVVARSA